ncbi:MAG: hypothetical protein ACYC54_15290 [Sedimentisphaerales bacterium]
MTDLYYCSKCKKEHSLKDCKGIEHLKYVLSKKEFGIALDYTFNAGAYAYITGCTEDYLRNTQVFGTLADKFQVSGNFNSPEAIQNWLSQHSEHTDHIFRKLVGDGAGEVDAIRQMNSGLRGLFYKTDFFRDASGHIPSNTAGIDAQTMNRFTGEIVKNIQIKANWSNDPANLRQTIREFLSNDHYSENVTIAGPKELIEEAQRMGVKNKLIIVNSTSENVKSGNDLMENIKSNDPSIHGHITFIGVTERVAKGAIIGVAVTATISSLCNYISYRQGKITGKQALVNIGKDSSKGAIVGGSLGGLSLLFPPGAVGLGIGIVVGIGLRKIIDAAYGDGAYREIVNSMSAVEAMVNTTAHGVVVVNRVNTFSEIINGFVEAKLDEHEKLVADTDKKLKEMN